MANAVIMPKLGATMDEGKIIRWIAREGDKVEKGMPLLEVESDKATLEVESLFEGTLLKILHSEDDEVPVLQTIGVIGTPGEDITGFLNNNLDSSLENSEETNIRSTPSAKYAAKENNVELNMVKPNEYGIITGKEVEEYLCAERIKVTPVAARIAQINNVTLDNVAHQGDKIYKADVLSHIDKQSQASQPTSRIAQAGQKTQKMSGIRKVTAKRMLETWQTVPMATNAIEVDTSGALRLCDEVNKRFSKDNIKINVTDILLKVIATAVAQHPAINAYLDGETITYRDEINIGLAVALENGLIVPVIRNVDRKGLLDINKEKRNLASTAREGKLGIDETKGGSITLTNLGSFIEGIAFPIINMPELCIIGAGKITKKPVVVDDEIVIRPMMWLTLTFNHRVLDGVPAARFLKTIKDIIEMPELLIC